MSARLRLITGMCVATLALGGLVACSDDGDEAGDFEFEGDIEVEVNTTDGCDFLDEKHCLFPFPNDRFTVEADTPSGRQVDFQPGAMPANVDGVTIDPSEWNRNDGFSPGSPILAFVPGLDLDTTGAAPITDMAASLDDDAPIVVIDAETGERHPYWAELDSNVEPTTDRPLLVHPARNFAEGSRYIVAFRDLRDSGDQVIEPAPAFQAYRDRLETGNEAVEARRDHMESLFEVLADADVSRDDLYLAWDFTVASAENLSGRLLHMRDDAFAALGDAAPEFSVTDVVFDPEDNVAARIDGTFQVPLYLTDAGIPGSRMAFSDDGLPERADEDYTATFTCIIPTSVAGPEDSPDPGRIVLYGHGLLGSGDQVMNSYVRATADELGLVVCGTDWIGMSTEDVANAVAILNDLSLFPSLADRSQQGILNFLFLGRLMLHDDGLSSDPAFQGFGGGPALDTTELYFYGISQGGIMGGAASAVAQDWDKAVLGVGAMNYSVLLNRSIDFDEYFAVLRTAYPDPIDRSVAYAFIQMLWDRGETNGYAHHLTSDPYPDTPAKTVIMQIAFGDHQVANVASDTMARTVGACAVQPALADDRSPDVQPLWDIPRFEAIPTLDCSAYVYFDSGAPAPPLTNTPPRDGADPHGDPRWAAEAWAQIEAFFQPEGAIIDPCDGMPCIAPAR